MRKYFLAAVVAVAAFATAAFAASLSIDAGTLQAGEAKVGQCITEDVEVSYGDVEFMNPGWTVDEITLDHKGECKDLAYSVAVTGTDSESVAWSTVVKSGVFDENAELVKFTTPFDAKGAGDVHLVIRTQTITAP